MRTGRLRAGQDFSDAVVEWTRLEVFWARGFLGHALTKLAKSLPAPAQRRVVLRKVAAYLEVKGLPSKTILIKVLDRACLHAVKQVVWQALTRATFLRPKGGGLNPRPGLLSLRRLFGKITRHITNTLPKPVCSS